jgi:serine protease DegQ
MEQLITTGTVTRGYIGVEPQDLTPELAQAFDLPREQGVIIAGVVRGGPAAKAGIRAGDILVSVNDTEILDTSRMLNTVAQLQPGSTANVKVVRDGQELTLKVEVGTRPKPRPQRQR